MVSKTWTTERKACPFFRWDCADTTATHFDAFASYGIAYYVGRRNVILILRFRRFTVFFQQSIIRVSKARWQERFTPPPENNSGFQNGEKFLSLQSLTLCLYPLQNEIIGGRHVGFTHVQFNAHPGTSEGGHWQFRNPSSSATRSFVYT